MINKILKFTVLKLIFFLKKWTESSVKQRNCLKDEQVVSLPFIHWYKVDYFEMGWIFLNKHSKHSNQTMNQNKNWEVTTVSGGKGMVAGISLPLALGHTDTFHCLIFVTMCTLKIRRMGTRLPRVWSGNRNPHLLQSWYLVIFFES